jgi:hypothetical protein
MPPALSKQFVKHAYFKDVHVDKDTGESFFMTLLRLSPHSEWTFGCVGHRYTMDAFAVRTRSTYFGWQVPMETPLMYAIRARLGSRTISRIRAATLVSVARLHGKALVDSYSPGFWGGKVNLEAVKLPDEMIVALMERCRPRELVALAGTCRTMHRVALDKHVMWAVLQRALPADAVQYARETLIGYDEIWNVIIGIAHRGLSETYVM